MFRAQSLCSRVQGRLVRCSDVISATADRALRLDRETRHRVGGHRNGDQLSIRGDSALPMRRFEPPRDDRGARAQRASQVALLFVIVSVLACSHVRRRRTVHPSTGRSCLRNHGSFRVAEQHAGRFGSAALVAKTRVRGAYVSAKRLDRGQPRDPSRDGKQRKQECASPNPVQRTASGRRESKHS